VVTDGVATGVAGSPLGSVVTSGVVCGVGLPHGSDVTSGVVCGVALSPLDDGVVSGVAVS
jgi:hypothetical protein